MHKNKLSILILFFLIKCTAFADISLPDYKDQLYTKYYFANVDSFSTYSFFVKKIKNNKTYKIKQDAAFLLTNDENDKIEVWAEEKSSKQKTNLFSLASTKLNAPIEKNTAYIAITFYFDKNKKLNYKQTVLKPDCYKRKQFVPIFSSTNNPINNNSLFVVALVSFAILTLLFLLKNKTKVQYV